MTTQKPSPDGKSDGRKARGARSREAVVQAMLAFVREGIARPSATEVARRANVSRRVVFNQFADMEALRVACLVRFAQEENARFWKTVSPDLPLPQRIKAFARARSDRLEFVAPFRHASMILAPLSPKIAGAIKAGSGRAHAEVKAVFDREIRLLPPRRRDRLARLLIATFSWPMWNFLRDDLDLSPPNARQEMAEMATAILERELKRSVHVSKASG